MPRPAPNASYQNRRNRAVGETGQMIASLLLANAGFEMVEPVHTPWRVLRDATGRITSAYPVEKVSGDFRAITTTGRSVLVEVKVRDRNLRWTDLEAHQRNALDRHAGCHGLSLLIWIHDHDGFILHWPIPNFGPGQSLTPELAASLAQSPFS